MTISFLIISGGKRDVSLKRLLKSIEAQRISGYETIVIGRMDRRNTPANVKFIDAPELADKADICKMRNMALESSSNPIAVLMDDDVELEPGWYSALKKYLDDDRWDIAGCRVLGPSGERWYDWNWASRTDPLCPPRTLEYGEQNDGLYISGCLMIIRRRVLKKIRFDENLLNHQRDDVDFCHRAIDAGFHFASFPEAVAIHHMEPAGRSKDDPGAGSDSFSEAIYLFRKGEHKKALELFRKQPSSTKVLYHIALTLKGLEKCDEACIAFENLLKRADRKNMDDRRFYYSGSFHMGALKEKERKPEEAQRYYREALKGFPEHKEAAEGLERVTGSFKTQ